MDKIIILWISQNNELSSKLIKELESNTEKDNIRILQCNPNDNIQQLTLMFNFNVVVIEFVSRNNNKEKIMNDILFEKHMSEIPVFYYSEFISLNLDLFTIGRENIVPVHQNKLVDTLLRLFFS